MSFRIGFGYDVHQLAEGESFYLGGIKIEHYKGAVGHSDADVLIHAICDALLGAANKRDIGFNFPDTDESYKDIDSKILLQKVVLLLKESDYTIGNIDATVSLQDPKISPHIPAMQEAIANAASIDISQVSIKATTTEKLGFVGKEEGVAAQAVVLINS